MVDVAEDDSPHDLSMADTPFAIAFHPTSRDMLAAGLVNGVVAVHDLARDDAERPVAEVAGGVRGSCRVVTWGSQNGRALLSGYEDGSLVVWDCSQAECRRAWQSRATGAASACLSLPEDMRHPSLFACGDDLGSVFVWDVRTAGDAVLSTKPHEDFVSALTTHDGALLACGADGRLSVSDPRRNLASLGISDPQDDELLSLQVLKDGRKVVCGTQTGAIIIWSWGYWGDSSDRALGHPESVDAMLKVDEDILCTGSSDGLLRIVRVQPGLTLIGILGDHDSFPIERLAANNDLTLVASISHDSLVRFWDARELSSLREGEETEMALPDSQAYGNVPMQTEANGNDEEDWETDDSDADDDDNNAAAAPSGGTSSSVRSGRPQLKSKAEMFFDGL